MQIKSRASRFVALATVATLASGTLFSPAPVQAAPKSKTYKAGAAALGVLGAVLIAKGKTAEGAAVLGGGYLAYKKGEKESQKERYGSNTYPDDSDRYGYNSTDFDGDRQGRDSNWNTGWNNNSDWNNSWRSSNTRNDDRLNREYRGNGRGGRNKWSRDDRERRDRDNRDRDTRDCDD